MRWRKGIIILLLASLPLSGASFASEPEVTIGIVHYAKPAKNSPIVEPTLRAIEAKLRGQYRVRVLSLQREALEETVKAGRVNIFLSSAGFYRRLIRYGARDLATAISPMYPDPNHSEGAAIVVLDRRTDLEKIADLKGMTLAVTSANAFSSYHVPLGEIASRGYDPFKFFREVREAKEGVNSEEPLKALKAGHVDVAFLKQCTLEEFLRTHPEDKGLYRVLEPKNSAHECARSTDLYPTWTLASTKSTTPTVSRLVTAAVLEMPKTEDDFVWGVSTDYSQVDELFRTLKIGPYQYLREWTVRRFITEYWPFVMLAVFGIVGLILHGRRAEHLVRKRTAQLRHSINERIQLEAKAKEATHRLETMQKIGVVNQLSAIFAHEMRQPLGAISLYLEGLKTMIDEGVTDKAKLHEVLDLIKQQNIRADSIVQRVRVYRKSSPKRDQEISLSRIVKDAVDTVSISDPSVSQAIETNLGNAVKVRGDALELELLVVNLIKNALEAVSDQSNGKVIVTVEESDKKVLLIVQDNGSVKTEEDLKPLYGSFESTKKDGLGIGLTIVKGIVERHRGRVEFQTAVPHGLKVIISFPKP